MKTLACIGSVAQTTGWPDVPNRSDDRRQRVDETLGAHPHDERQPSGPATRVEPLAELDDLTGGRRRAELDPERVPDAGEELDVRAVRLVRALADPEHVRRAVVPVAGQRVPPGQRLFVVEHEALVARPEVDAVQPSRLGDVDAAGADEGKRALDLAGEHVVAPPFG